MNRVVTFLKGALDFQISKTLVRLALVVVLIAALATVSLASYANGVVKGLADNLIRFHVVANSDSPEDQQVKRIVRDHIIEYMNERLKHSRDIEQTKNIIISELQTIEKLAGDEAKKAGKEYDAEASLGQFPFPTKVYGDITLPAGKYQALRVVLGEGRGTNWWCVLFPPLCFVDVTHSAVPEPVKSDLKNVLSQEDYNIITAGAGKGDMPVRLKLKAVEIFQQSQIKIAGAFNKLMRSPH